MNRETYIRKVKKQLDCSVKEKEEIVRDLQEIFDSGKEHGKSESQIIKQLGKPQAYVSIFVPGELLTAAGLTPYSVEAMSCFIAGTQCEQPFLRKTEEEGFPETMCSYHRVFLGVCFFQTQCQPFLSAFSEQASLATKTFR